LFPADKNAAFLKDIAEEKSGISKMPFNLCLSISLIGERAL
jgi:hypothetical protein